MPPNPMRDVGALRLTKAFSIRPSHLVISTASKQFSPLEQLNIFILDPAPPLLNYASGIVDGNGAIECHPPLSKPGQASLSPFSSNVVSVPNNYCFNKLADNNGLNEPIHLTNKF